MNIKEMHYAFKMGLNKIDSQQNRNFQVPEIDWLLNQGLKMFIRLRAKPERRHHSGFEVTQSNTDDMKALVVSPRIDPRASIIVSDNLVELPEDYLYYIRGRVEISKGDCKGQAVLYIQQHDDLFEEDTFTKSSFEWRHVNGVFQDEKILLHDDGTFNNINLNLTYIRQPKYMHNAEDFRQGTYKALNGETLTGTQECELSVSAHDKVVDLAVMLASENIQSQAYQTKLQKIQLENLI